MDHMRVLVVEDDDKVAGVVRRALEAERMAVDTARDGRQGLGAATSTAYDILIVDLMLPGIDGTEIIRRLRQHNTQVPVLVLTARDRVADKITNFEAGADDYLTKPFALAELVVRVKALLRRGPVNRGNLLKVADLEIDRVAHTVKRAGATIKLTAKEYGLLEYLAANSGRVLSRAMIVEHVWDESFEGLTNIVDVYVRQVRVKVDEPHPVKLIHTVRGVGYCLSAEQEQ
jgi:two-component system copper resistance phosphate regulon response regulator CusR